MADGTRATQTVNRLSSIEEQLQEVVELLKEVQLRLTLLEVKQDQQTQAITQTPVATNPSPQHTFHDSNTASPFKSMRITIPRYNGGNPESWIQKIEYYYSFHTLSDQDKLTLTSFHMDGPAEEWFLWLSKTNRLNSWADFLQALRNRYGPSKYRDLRGELAKLLQNSTVAEYQLQFETLCNQITGVDEVFLQSCFESGLKPAIRREVRLHRPTSLDQAMELAKLIEDKITDGLPKHPSNPIPKPPPPPSSGPGILPTPNRPPLPTRKLTPAEILDKREKGLCYNCDEKFTRNHICKGKMFALVLEDAEDTVDIPGTDQIPYPDTITPPATDSPEISFHALDGQLHPHTFRITGILAKHMVQVLVDSGSTNSFLQQ